MKQKFFVVLISGNGSNLQALIDAVDAQRIHGSIATVISNRPDVRGLERARQAKIETKVIDHTDYENREAFDAALMAFIDQLQPELVVLAGFMRILSNEFIQHYAGKILNIHPSVLPELKGLHTHKRALEAGKQVHGASVHFVNNELDSGPVVLQTEVPVLAEDDENSLAARVLEQEHIIYPMAVEWFLHGRLALINNQVVLDNQIVNTPPKWISNQLIPPNQ